MSYPARGPGTGIDGNAIAACRRLDIVCTGANLTEAAS